MTDNLTTGPIGSNQIDEAVRNYDARPLGWNRTQSIDWSSVQLTVVSPATEPMGSNQVDFSKPQLAPEFQLITISCGQVSHGSRTYALGEFYQKFKRNPTEEERVKPDYRGMGPGVIMVRGVINKNIPLEGISKSAANAPKALAETLNDGERLEYLEKKIAILESSFSRLLTAIPLIVVVVIGIAAIVAKFVK